MHPCFHKSCLYSYWKMIPSLDPSCLLDASGETKSYWSHYNQWCCLHWMLQGSSRQIPDRKLLPRFIYDVLTQISNDFQRSLYRVQADFSCSGGHPKCKWVCLHRLLTSGSSAVDGCRQNESPKSWENITIIHKYLWLIGHKFVLVLGSNTVF